VLATHTAHAKFVHDVGGLYLQLTDDRPKGRTVTRDDHKHLGRLLTEIGKRASDYGVLVGYHNHMGSLGERPEELDWILEASDPHFVKLELDTAHCVQGTGDPVKVIERYRGRLLFLHIKDVESVPSAENPKRNYRFVELGRGRVDLPAVFDALHKMNFRGWAIVELDAVPEKDRTPKECAEISKKYLEERLGVTV
jgi:inosose dehydratase